MVQPLTLSPWEQHKRAWQNCTACPLCERRKNVVLLRGSIPAPVLFVGEAPGDSEDVHAKPFWGPAGDLLQRIIDEAQLPASDYALTNLIGCVPKDESYAKVETSNPLYWLAVEACEDRLREVIELVKPKLLVCVGKEAKDVAPRTASKAKLAGYPKVISITHPAAILRANIGSRGLAVQKCVVAVSEAYEEIQNV